MSNPSRYLRTISTHILEVERKFKPSPESIKLLRKNAGAPAFRSFKRLEPKLLEDTYYDHRSILSSNGIWLRLRNDNWESKVNHGGNFTNSRFEELAEVHDINEVLKKHIPQARVGENGDFWGLEEIAKFTTFRQAWRVDEDFEVALDKADFGHVVGEVEMVGSVEGDHDLDVRKEETMAILDGRIEEFMKRYPWAFPEGKVRGKMSAYLRLRAAQAACERNNDIDKGKKTGY